MVVDNMKAARGAEVQNLNRIGHKGLPEITK